MKDLILPVVILTAAFMFLRKAFESGGMFNKPSGHEERLKKLQAEMDEIDANTLETSKTPEQLKQIATEQYESMFGFGTNEEKLKTSLNGLSDADLWLVYKFFGIRNFKPFLEFSFFDNDLFGWYRAELSGKDLQDMKDIWNSTGLWS